MSVKYSKGKKIAPLETFEVLSDNQERHDFLQHAQTLIREANIVTSK